MTKQRLNGVQIYRATVIYIFRYFLRFVYPTAKRLRILHRFTIKKFITFNPKTVANREGVNKKKN